MMKIKKNKANKCNEIEANKYNTTKAVTLVALVITIIILLVLVGVTLVLIIGKGALLEKSDASVSEYNKQEATEAMNLKITNIQIKSYTETQKLPSLQYLADNLCEDDDMEYVIKKQKEVASLNKIDVSDVESIFTKIKKYPYEFEIDTSLRLASINGIKMAQNGNIEKLEQDIASLQEENANLKQEVIDLKNNQTTMQDSLNNLQTQITSQQTQISSLQSSISSMDINYRSGTLALSNYTSNKNGLGIDYNIKFSSPLPNANYSVNVTKTSWVGGFEYVHFAVTSKTKDGFVLNSYIEPNLTCSGLSINWIAMPYK